MKVINAQAFANWNVQNAMLPNVFIGQKYGIQFILHVDQRVRMVKIFLLQYEQCNDQNNESTDGCFQFKFECTDNCLLCNLAQDFVHIISLLNSKIKFVHLYVEIGKY
ncbi:unnamed protein product [Paramecium pentaurelia]|uniref:Uncharacterized protein n=1 Tax=Paramecium pentaurelia TaxID=43138 RepID=A0A8S1WDU8_9CILI|nr:unnamed protein product [Paramecium pentaurelia]